MYRSLYSNRINEMILSEEFKYRLNDVCKSNISSLVDTVINITLLKKNDFRRAALLYFCSFQESVNFTRSYEEKVVELNVLASESCHGCKGYVQLAPKFKWPSKVIPDLETQHHFKFSVFNDFIDGLFSSFSMGSLDIMCFRHSKVEYTKNDLGVLAAFNSNEVIDYKSWSDFLKSEFLCHFCGYEYVSDISGKKVSRFLKKVDGTELLIGFEYDEIELKKKAEKGFFVMPELVPVLIDSRLSNKLIKNKNACLLDIENITILSSMFPPWIICGFSKAGSLKNEDAYVSKKAQFYIGSQSHFGTAYLEFIEGCIKEVCLET